MEIKFGTLEFFQVITLVLVESGNVVGNMDPPCSPEAKMDGIYFVSQVFKCEI